MARDITLGQALLQRPRIPGLTRRDWRPLYEPAVFLVVTSIAYQFLPSNAQFVLTTGVVYALLATSLGVLFGWSGIYTFGHAAFFGVGAYTVGLLKELDLSPLVLLLLSGTAAAVIALVVVALGARLVKVEFAMLTLIVGQIAFVTIYRVPALEGDDGIYGIPRGDVFGLSIVSSAAFWWYAIIVIAIILGVLRRIHLSPFGESLNAVRDDPTKAAAIGIPVRAMRFAAFTLAGGVAGIAGAIFAQQQGIISPTAVAFNFSGQIVIMALLGGMARFWGPAVGALLFVFLNLAIFGSSPQATFWLGAILLLIVMVFPNGVLGLVSTARSVFARIRRGR